MASDPPRRPEDLSAEERQRLRLAHGRLRIASQACEALTATEPLRGRWAPEPAPPEALEAAQSELEGAYQAVLDCQQELLG